MATVTTLMYCLKCRKKTTIDGEYKDIQTKKGLRYAFVGKCKICGASKTQFASKPNPEPKKN